MKKNNIEKLLKKEKLIIDKLMEKYIPRKINKKYLVFLLGKENSNLNPETIQKTVSDPVWNLLDRGGKRWRPILFLLLADIFGKNSKEMKDFSVIPEIIHNGTLIIDDIEDSSSLRRGKPCVHRLFGEDIAINVGNLIYFLPLAVFQKNRQKFSAKIYQEAYEIYIQEMINLNIGQATEIGWHNGMVSKISEKEYYQMVSHKTGAMVRMSVKFASIFGGISSSIAQKLVRVFDKIAIAFQIQDDVLDVDLEIKDRKKFGKLFGNDIKEGKKSLMVIYTLNKATKKDKQKLLKILNKPNNNLKEINEAIEILYKYKSIRYAKKKSEDLIKEAKKEMDPLLKKSKNKNKEKLQALVNFLVQRKY